MARGDGFDVMDLSTRVHKDPKFRSLARKHPDLIGPAFLVYVATLAESWGEGDRVPVQDAWPALVPFQADVVDALVESRLVDPAGLVARATWDAWFGEANHRREASRERWRRANANRADTAREPRGNSDVDRAVNSDVTARLPRPGTASTVPIRSVPSVDIPPTPTGGHPKRTNGTAPRARGTNPRANGTSPRQVAERHDRAAPQYLGDILERTRAMQQAVNDLGAGKPDDPEPEKERPEW